MPSTKSRFISPMERQALYNALKILRKKPRPRLNVIIRAKFRQVIKYKPNIEGKRTVLICGLHRSGTSLIHRVLRAHPDISGISGSGAPEDEGQHLQTVFPTARAFGGPGSFAFDERCHLTDTSDLVSEENREILLKECGRYYDFRKSVLIEKSPPNIISSRFFQAMFPCAYFLFVVRHPIATSMATQKWSGTSMRELLDHWSVAHNMMMDDMQYIHRCIVVRYEDFVLSPENTLNAILDFVGRPHFHITEQVSDQNQKYFGEWNPSSVADPAPVFGAGARFEELFSHSP